MKMTITLPALPELLMTFRHVAMRERGCNRGRGGREARGVGREGNATQVRGSLRGECGIDER